MPEERATLDAVMSRLDDIREDMREVRDEVRTTRENFVSTATWQARNSEVNTRLNSLGREIGDLRTEVRAAKAPWWTWVTVLCGVGALIVSIVLR